MDKVNLFLIENYMKHSYKELADMIYQDLGLEMSTASLKNRVSRLGIASKNRQIHNFTKEQNEWLRAEAPNYTYNSLCDLFNKKFNVNVNTKSLQRYCFKHLKIHVDKNTKGDYKSFVAKDIGYERESEGYLWVKVKNDMRGAKKNWMMKQRYVWEQTYGSIPEGHRIVFLDGNCLNCDISNLACVPVSIQTSLSYLPKETSIRKCKIANMRLKQVLKEVECLDEKNLG